MLRCISTSGKYCLLSLFQLTPLSLSLSSPPPTLKGRAPRYPPASLSSSFSPPFLPPLPFVRSKANPEEAPPETRLLHSMGSGGKKVFLFSPPPLFTVFGEESFSPPPPPLYVYLLIAASLNFLSYLPTMSGAAPSNQSKVFSEGKKSHLSREEANKVRDFCFVSLPRPPPNKVAEIK